MNRVMDRFFASLGLLEDAAPLFQSRERVPHAGLLLAIPAILQSGVLECARRIYSSIGPAFHGLRTTLVTLVLMALLRLKRPEGLKERAPQDLGRVLGLDRAPEVKTVRRKLVRLASFGKAAEFGRRLDEMMCQIRDLQERRAKVPRRVPVAQTVQGAVRRSRVPEVKPTIRG